MGMKRKQGREKNYGKGGKVGKERSKGSER